MKETPSKKRKLDASSTVPTRAVKSLKLQAQHGLAEKQKDLFESFWTQQQSQLERSNLDSKSLQQLVAFTDTASKQDVNSKLPTALLLTGLDDGNGRALREGLRNEVNKSNRVAVDIRSRQCPNLQSALKNIIKETILTASSLNTYNEFLAKHKRLIPLNFDLELLEHFVKMTELSQVIIALVDVETFDMQVTNELISTLSVWRHRIPFMLMLGVSSTKELFESRLSKSCLKIMEIQAFDFAPHPNISSDIMWRTQCFNEGGPAVFLGPSAMFALHETIGSQGSSVLQLEQVLKFMYMSHFLANPLCLLSTDAGLDLGEDELSQLIQTARKTDSFKRYCENLLSQKHKASSSTIKTLLTDDNACLAKIKETISKDRIAYNAALLAIKGLADLHFNLAQVDSKIQRPRMETESQLYQNMKDLTDCTVFDEIEASIKSLSARRLLHILRQAEDAAQSIVPNLSEMLSILEHKLVDSLKSGSVSALSVDSRPTSKPSETKGRSKKLSSAVSAQKGSTEVVDITSVVEGLLTNLKDSLRRVSIDVSSLLLHEAYILSSRSVRFKPNFEPHPRAAVERGLLRPGDYLGCDCCTTANPNHIGSAGLEHGSGEIPSMEQKNSIPAAAILFTLLQEAPTIINVRDLFDAFQSRLLPAKDTSLPGNDNDAMSNTAMAQFYQSLAEMKMSGLIKASTGTQIKKKGAGKNSKQSSQDVDFIAKTSWAGL